MTEVNARLADPPQSRELPPEPMMQQGVRQYAPRAIAIGCILLSVGLAAIWARSQSSSDSIRVYSTVGVQILLTDGESLMFVRRVVPVSAQQTGWERRSRPPSPSRIVPWPPGMLSRIGFQIDDGDPFRFAGAARGSWWMRVHLLKLIAVLMLFPAGRWIVQYRRSASATPTP